MSYERRPILPRPCRHCGGVFTPAHANLRYCHDECRMARQGQRAKEASRNYEATHREERRRQDRESRAADPEAYRAKKREQKARNPEHYRAKRREWYRTHKDQERAAYREWQSRNRAARTAYMADWTRRMQAIQCGKVDFGATGFALARTCPRDGVSFWRPVLAGCPIAPNEEAVARYEPDGEGRWIVSALFTSRPEARRLAAVLAAREVRLRSASYRRVTRPSAAGAAAIAAPAFFYRCPAGDALSRR